MAIPLQFNQLPGTAPITGTEVMPVQQAGVTSQVPAQTLVTSLVTAYTGAFNILSGVFTYATLPAPGTNINKFAVTSDQGAVFSNGSYWQVLFNPTTGTLAISTNSPLPQAQLGSAYSQTMAATAGVAPYVWSLVSSFGAANVWSMSSGGVLTGTPTTVSHASSNVSDILMIQVSDATGAVAQKLVTIVTVAALNPAATPTFSPVAGTYSGTQAVTISCSTGSSTIYYTTNGSIPTTGSTVYTTPVSVSSSLTLKAIATAAGFTQSAVGSAAYVISAVVNRMGGLMSAGGGGSYTTEIFPTFKNRFREGYVVSGTTFDASGWPASAHSVILSNASLLPSWASGTFKCGFIGTGTPTHFNANSTVANVVLGNGTSTYTTFDLTASAASFGFTNSAAATKIFAYLPAYPASVIDDPTNPNSVTTEAAALYAGLRHIRTEWHGVALWNSQLMTQSNRNSATNTQTFHQDNQWFGQQTATLGSLPALGATSSTLSGWTRGAGTWLFVFEETGFTYEGRICTVGAGANPTISWAAGRGLTAAAISTTVFYGTEGYPIEWMLALAVAANTGLVICEPALQDGTNGVAGTYTAGTLALINTYITTYPAWTAPVLLTPGNEDWNSTYNTFRIYTEQAAIAGYASRQTYGAAWMHALANLGRTQFGSGWGQGQRVGAVLEWQDAQPGQFFATLDYLQNTLSVTPKNDIAWIATAPYMNPSGLSGASTIANIVAAVNTSAGTQAAASKSENVAIMGLHYGIPLMTYEGAPQWNGGAYSGVTNLGAAIMDPTYAAPIETYYNNLSNSGFQAFSHTTLGVTSVQTGGNGTAGELGTIYGVTTSNTPNWTALQQVATNNPTYTRNVISGSGSTIAGGNYADQTGAANPAFPSGTFTSTNGSPYYSGQGYIGWFFNCTVAGTYTLVVTCAGTGTPGTNVEIGNNSGSSIQLSGKTLAAGTNSLGSVTIPKGPGYILLGNGSAQSTLTMTQLQFN